MRSLVCSVLVALCAGGNAAAQTDIAKLLTASSQPDAKTLESTVRAGLQSEDARVRAVAARIANVRRMQPLVSVIGALADREPDANAAREELRAMIMLGGLRQVDRAFYISDRFSKRLDGDVATAAARLGSDAVEAYFASMQKRNIDRNDFFLAALWNRPQLASSVAARLLANDVEGFQAFLYMSRFEPRIIIDTETLKSALASSNFDVRASTTWFLVHQALRSSATFDPRLKEAIGTVRVPRDNADLIAGIELLRRALGYPRRDFIEFRYALANELVGMRMYFAPSKIIDLLTDTEKRIAAQSAGDISEQQNVDVPPFVLPSPLPEGLAATAMSMTGCRDGWIGTAKVKIDDNGFVVSRDLSRVNTTEPCRQALAMLLDYSIAENTLVSAPRQSDSVSLVRAGDGPMCFDEGHVASMPTAYVYGSPSIRMPRVRKRRNPPYPAGAPRTSQDVIVEAMVTSLGCVRAVRPIKPVANGAINEAAMLAVQGWQFEPALINTSPIDMLVDVTVEFRP